MRARFKKYSIEANLSKWIEPLVKERVLGFKSYTEVITEATRTYLVTLVELGLHPWGPRSALPAELKRSRVSAAGPSKTQALLFLLVASVGMSWILLKGASISGLAVGTPDLLNIPLTYARFAPLIDFFIYAMLFSSIAYVTVGKKFGHPGVAASLGLMLAIALSAYQSVIGFSIKSLGPFAIALFLFLVGILVFQMIKTLNVSSLGAAALAFFFLYLGFLVYVPKLISAVRSIFPLDLIVLAAVVIGAWKVSRTVKARTTAPSAEQVQELLPQIEQYYPSSTATRQIVGKYLERITKKSVKDSDKILGELAYALEVIDRFKNDPAALAGIAQKLQRIPPRQHQITKALEALDALVKQVQRADVKQFSALRKKYKSLTKEQQKQLKGKIATELARLNVEQQVTQLRTAHNQYDQAFSQTLRAATNQLAAGNPSEAKKYLLDAISLETKARDQLRKIKDLEKSLKALTAKDIPLPK